MMGRFAQGRFRRFYVREKKPVAQKSSDYGEFDRWSEKDGEG
jgi:hypothetical protein